MEAFPPGSDQLPSWESRKSSEHAHASRGYTAQRDEGRWGWRGGGRLVQGEEGERTAFNIILGSGLIRFVFPFPFIAICLEGKRPFTVVS